jgi:hypothetical protein
MTEGRPPVSPLIAYLDALYRAAMARDVEDLAALLLEPIASHVPREVREEALAIVALPDASLRAPIQLLQFRQRTLQLEVEEREGVEEQLPIERSRL